jgi:hypothetical protein
VTLAELEHRVKVLEDIEEIKKIQIRYVNSLLKVEFENLADCFAEDAILDLHAGTVKGKKEILKLFKDKLSAQHIGQEGEFMVHPVIEVDGDHGKASWLLYLQWAQPRKLVHKPGLLDREDAPDWAQGFYDAEYVREKGNWKISRLRWRCRLISPLDPEK